MRKKSSTSYYQSPPRRAGTRLYRYVLLLLALWAAGYPAQAQTEKRIYTVGNSVTDGVNFAGFKALAESRGYVHTLARHMIPGAPLSWLWDNQNSGFTESPYGAPNNAFPNYTWDAITLQPFDRMIEGSDGDRQMARNYINLARGKSPNVQFYIYSRYPRKKDGLAETAANWNSLWLAQYTGGYDGTNETRDFFEDLTTAVRADYAGTGLKQPLMIPLGQAMHALNNKMAAGQVPGFSNIWQVYADGIHMTNVGSYIVACSFFATIYKESPVGLPVPSQYGTIANAVRDIIQQTVWETVTNNSSWTGVSGGTVSVTGVSVSPTSLSLTLNQTGQLTPTISPANATNKTVSWSSSNTGVATVSATGLVTGVAVGTATITVTTQDGARTATASVTVSSNAVPVTGVSVAPTSVTVNTGNTTTLTATVAPANASNKNVSWSSGNTAVATVSSTGVVTGVSAGTATITVTTQDGARTATSAVTVTANSKPVAVISATPTSGTAPLAVQFSAGNSTDPNPGDFILGFDWDFGDGSPRANSNAPSHTYTTAGTYTVTLRVMDNHDLYSDPVSRTITVGAGGSIVREYWTGVTGTTVAEIPVTANPTGTDNLSSLEGPTNWADNYGSRIRAFITPATTGTYTFYIAGDDNSQLFLGTNDSPATKTKIAEVTGWTLPREWNKYTTQTSTARSLTAGTRYYVEVLHKEGGGGDNVAVGWTGPGISAITVIGGSVLSPYTTTGLSGTYKLTARHSNKALDVANSATQDGANVQQWTDNGTFAQQWIITATTDGFYRLLNRGSNKALEVANFSLADGGNVQQWTYTGVNSQQWKIEATTDGFHRLINRESGKALDVAGVSTADGANVHQWTYLGGGNQQWRLTQLSTATSRVASVEADGAETGNALRVYPNPVTTGRLTLQLNAREKGNATVTLTGATGRVTVRAQLPVQAGENTLTLSTGGSASGLYLLTVTEGSRRIVKKIHVQ
jgi:uncharacterized protein YjdB